MPAEPPLRVKITKDHPDYYGRRTMPWSEETADQCHARVARAGLSEEFDQLRRIICKEKKTNYNEATYEALCRFTPEYTAELEKAEAAVDEDGEADLGLYLRKCRQGLRRNIRRRASIEDEIDWIAENVEKRLPEVHKAPSYKAIALLMRMKTSDRVADNFWLLYVNKRMTPGNKNQPKDKAFKEDQVDEAALAAEGHQAELMNRLFGT